MKKKTTHKPTRSSFSLLRQLCNLIPADLVPELARDTGVEDRVRTFKPWSHVVGLLYAQLTHALSLNDVETQQFVLSPQIDPKFDGDMNWRRPCGGF